MLQKMVRYVKQLDRIARITRNLNTNVAENISRYNLTGIRNQRKKEDKNRLCELDKRCVFHPFHSIVK